MALLTLLDDLKLRNLRDVSTIIDSGVKRFNGLKKYVKTGDVKDNQIIATNEVTYENRPSRANMEVQEGDVLCARMNATVKVLLVSAKEKEYLFSTGFAVLRPKTEIVLPKFLMHSLRSNYFQAQKDKAAEGATQKAVNNDSLQKLRINVPLLSIQERVVSIFERTDLIRYTRMQANQLASKIIQSVFLKMFNPTRAEYENWKIWSVEELALPLKGAIQSGPFGSDLHNRDFIKEGVLAVGIDNVYPNMFVMGRGRHITKEKYKELIKFTACTGDVLITVMGTVGRSCVFSASASPAIITKHVYRISLDQTKCFPEFLASSVNWDMEIRRQLGASITGAIVDGLTSKSIKSLKVRLPPFQEQLRFVNLLNRYTKIHACQQESTRKIEELSHTLMCKAFNGELTSEAKKISKQIPTSQASDAYINQGNIKETNPWQSLMSSLP